MFGKSKDVEPVQIGDAVYSVNDRLAYMGDASREQDSYTRLNEYGQFEGAGTSIFLTNHRTGELGMIGDSFEADLIRTVEGALSCLDRMEVSPPVYLYVAVHGVEGVPIMSSARGGPYNGGGFGTGQYAPPAVEISNLDSDVPELLRDPLNRFWTKARWNHGSPYYDEDGWRPRRG